MQTPLPNADREIFLFINSSSGSGIGEQLSKLQGPMKFTLDVPKHYHMHIGFKKQKQVVNAHFYNMKVNHEQGFGLLKQFINQNKKCFGVVCGGDGTVTWVISELHKYEIPSIKVPFSVIPLGTGNDFSQSLGWGATTQDLLSDDYHKLKKFFIKMLLSKDEDLDVWEITAKANDYGKIQKWEKQQHKNIGTQITKPFVNYFSFGLDGKVGYSFDMHRTQSRLGNLTVYGALGFLKGITKTKNLNQLLQNFKESRKCDQKGKISFVQDQDDEIIFTAVENGQESSCVYQYNQNILALNINSFMGGAKDIWKNSTGQPADKKYSTQSSSDGKLQFVSFSGSLSIGMQKTMGGFANRVYQGTGPFYFNFKKYDPKQKHRTYLQVDGEFYRFSHPKEVCIQKSPFLKGKFRVLRWQSPPRPKGIGCCGCF